MHRKLLALIGLALLLIVVDTQRVPADQFLTRGAIRGIHVYQATLSKWYARAGVQCRFTITCSDYGEMVIQRFGAVRGGWIAMKRVVRCGPWTPLGTADAPPTT